MNISLYPCQLAFMDISQMKNSYVNLPWVNNLLLNTKNTRSEGILTAKLSDGIPSSQDIDEGPTSLVRSNSTSKVQSHD